MPLAGERDRDADDDLVEAEPHAEDDHDERGAHAGRPAGQEAEPLRVAVVGAEEAGVGAEQHHPLEPDVEHACPLRDRLAERREHQRHAGEQATGDHARPEHRYNLAGDQDGHARLPADDRRFEGALEAGRDVAAAEFAPAAEVLDHRHEQQDQGHQHEQEVGGQVRLWSWLSAAREEHREEGDEGNHGERVQAREEDEGDHSVAEVRVLVRPQVAPAGEHPAAAAAPMSAPLIRKLAMTTRGTLTPMCLAARGLRPRICSRSPNEVRVSMKCDGPDDDECDDQPDVDRVPGMSGSILSKSTTASAASARSRPGTGP